MLTKTTGEGRPRGLTSTRGSFILLEGRGGYRTGNKTQKKDTKTMKKGEQKKKKKEQKRRRKRHRRSRRKKVEAEEREEKKETVAKALHGHRFPLLESSKLNYC